MRTDWANDRQMHCVLMALMPVNRLILEVCLSTGLRVSDVCELKRAQLIGQRFTVREKKTGKSKRVYISADLYWRLVRNSGDIYIFEGRGGKNRHRTRQAVWRDVKRAAAFFTKSGLISRKQNIAPHTTRKCAAVAAMQTGGYDKAKRLLNHSTSDKSVTMLYALADSLTSVNMPKKRGAKRG